MTKTLEQSGLVPKLRFPEFRGDGAWDKGPLSKLAIPVKERAVNVDDKDVLTLSVEHGLVRQTEYFGKQIAGSNLERYLKIRKNDFVYNDRVTSASKYGTIKRLKTYGIGAVSPIYKCFRFQKAEVPHFWECYFEADAHEKSLGEHVNEGARAGRFNISVTIFLSISVHYPSKTEQQKIAECLGSLDDLIAAHRAKLAALQDHKKGLLQKLFPGEGQTTPELRFPGFEGEWKERKFESLCQSISSGKDKRDPDGEYCLYGSTGIIGKTSHASYCGQRLLIARVGANAGFLSKADGEYGVTDNTLVITLSSSTHFNFIFHYIGSININELIFGSGQPLITGSILKNLKLFLPNIEEQQKIADCLSALDDQISAQSDQIAALQEHKQGLMQQLFPNLEAVSA